MGWSNGKDKLITSLKFLTQILGYFVYFKLVTSQACHLLHHCCLRLLGTFLEIPSEQEFHWFLYNLRYNVHLVGLILLYCNITTVALTCLSCHTIIISYCFKNITLWRYFFSQSVSIFFFFFEFSIFTFSNGIIQYMVPCYWLLWLRIMFADFIHIVTCNSASSLSQD